MKLSFLSCSVVHSFTFAYTNVLCASPCYIRCFGKLLLKMSFHSGMSKKISKENWIFLLKRLREAAIIPDPAKAQEVK